MAEKAKLDETRALLNDALNRAVRRVADAQKLLRQAQADERRLRSELGGLDPSL